MRMMHSGVVKLVLADEAMHACKHIGRVNHISFVCWLNVIAHATCIEWCGNLMPETYVTVTQVNVETSSVNMRLLY